MVVIDDLHVSWFGNMHYDYVGEQEVDFDIIYFGEQKCNVPQATIINIVDPREMHVIW